MTTGRIDKGVIDQRKGFDEILEILPNLRKSIPEVIYLIIGDGDDTDRLKTKAKELKVDDITIFIGYVDEESKSDYFRLADLYAMPGSSDIFDTYPFRFVFLEALACGIPVVGSAVTDHKEKLDYDSSNILIQVNPKDKDSIIKGIKSGLRKKEKYKSYLKKLHIQ